MPQLLSREFLLKVLMTIGTFNLIQHTGFSEEKILSMSIGLTEITETELEAVYSALSQVA